MIIGTITYIKLAHGTFKRLHGEDSSCSKFMNVLGPVVGGSLLIGSLVHYDHTCAQAFSDQADGTGRLGIGFFAIFAGTILKLGVGLVHLCLPVEETASYHA